MPVVKKRCTRDTCFLARLDLCTWVRPLPAGFRSHCVFFSFKQHLCLFRLIRVKVVCGWVARYTVIRQGERWGLSMLLSLFPLTLILYLHTDEPMALWLSSDIKQWCLNPLTSGTSSGVLRRGIIDGCASCHYSLILFLLPVSFPFLHTD